MNKSLLSIKGSLTIQFLLGFILCLSFVMFFAVMILTITTASITQYITYSTARQLFLGMNNKGAQEKWAKDRYKKLTQDKFKGLFSSTSQGFSFSLFKVFPQIEYGQGIGHNPNFSGLQDRGKFFYGVWTPFEAKLLSINTMWGNTESADGFKTMIGSYLGREPTGEDCKSFNDFRWNEIERQFNYVMPRAYADFDNSNLQIVFDNGC